MFIVWEMKKRTNRRTIAYVRKRKTGFAAAYVKSHKEDSMMATANIVSIYASADAAGKFELICKNYSTFLGTVESFTEGLRYMIESEKEYNRSVARNELGVRVQGSSKTHSNVTEDMAINRILTREAIVECDFSGGVLNGVSQQKEVQEQARVLRNMRKDYELFNCQLKLLDVKEAQVFLWYLMKEKDLASIAENEGIEYHSMVQRIRRTKDKVKCQMLLFLKREWLGGTADVEE